MNRLCLLAILAMSLNFLNFLNFQKWQPAFADDYELNPNAPNGYAASMAGYHYTGSYRAPTEEQNGYEATAIRSRYGLDPLLVPKSDDDSDDGWGDDSSSDTSDNYWGNHFRRRCQPQGAQGGFGGGATATQKAIGTAIALRGMQTYRNYRRQSPGPAPVSLSNQFLQSARNYNNYSGTYGNSTALRRALSARPMGTMGVSQQGGFNRIYTGE